MEQGRINTDALVNDSGYVPTVDNTPAEQISSVPVKQGNGNWLPQSQETEPVEPGFSWSNVSRRVVNVGGNLADLEKLIDKKISSGLRIERSRTLLSKIWTFSLIGQGFRFLFIYLPSLLFKGVFDTLRSIPVIGSIFPALDTRSFWAMFLAPIVAVGIQLVLICLTGRFKPKWSVYVYIAGILANILIIFIV